MPVAKETLIIMRNEDGVWVYVKTWFSTYATLGRPNVCITCTAFCVLKAALLRPKAHFARRLPYGVSRIRLMLGWAAIADILFSFFTI
jgi:hypothetical protein